MPLLAPAGVVVWTRWLPGRSRGCRAAHVVAGPLTWLPVATVRFSVGSLRRPDGQKNLVALRWLVIEERSFGRDSSQLRQVNCHLCCLGRGPVSGTAGDVPRIIIKY